ncbi:MAG: ribose ABC transporter [Rhizobiaceae bacterium]|nr:ribose ABC transporter [Rhizobiaceae bacterium]
MLRGIDPILSPELLGILRAMGHGDEIVIADANFPAVSNAKRLVRLDGIDAPRVVKAILSLMPLDAFVDDPALSMAVVGDSAAVPPVVSLFQQVIDTVADKAAKITPLERFAFYERARGAFAIVATGETRHYGNLILKKGVLPSGGVS